MKKFLLVSLLMATVGMTAAAVTNQSGTKTVPGIPVTISGTVASWYSLEINTTAINFGEFNNSTTNDQTVNYTLATNTGDFSATKSTDFKVYLGSGTTSPVSKVEETGYTDFKFQLQSGTGQEALNDHTDDNLPKITMKVLDPNVLGSGTINFEDQVSTTVPVGDYSGEINVGVVFR